MESMAKSVQEAAEEGKRLEIEFTQARDKRQQCASRLKVLREMQRDYEGYQFSVKNVLMQARRQQNSGVHGVVATLIKVPRKLERAIDVALGPALQNVVVDREEDAKGMIEYLKANRLGRATFLPLSSVKGRTLDAQERRLLSMPGCLGLASELIEYQPQYQGVAQNLLGRTVVAQDLNAGIEIMRAGRHAFRLVTLEGDVMNPGGSMTGGSLQSRMTSLLSREREMGEHRNYWTSLEAEMEEKPRRIRPSWSGERVALKQERAELFDRAAPAGNRLHPSGRAHVGRPREQTSQLARSEKVKNERARLDRRSGCMRRCALLESPAGFPSGGQALRIPTGCRKRCEEDAGDSARPVS